jgi:hypothetical protein
MIRPSVVAGSSTADTGQMPATARLSGTGHGRDLESVPCYPPQNQMGGGLIVPH